MSDVPVDEMPEQCERCGSDLDGWGRCSVVGRIRVNGPHPLVLRRSEPGVGPQGSIDLYAMSDGTLRWRRPGEPA